MASDRRNGPGGAAVGAAVEAAVGPAVEPAVGPAPGPDGRPDGAPDGAAVLEAYFLTAAVAKTTLLLGGGAGLVGGAVVDLEAVRDAGWAAGACGCEPVAGVFDASGTNGITGCAVDSDVVNL